nr:HlyD family efflux transporter periplasmic adaptor subunit [Bacteroidota bacterium]
MKYKILNLIFAASLIFLLACNRNDEKSDAYGNFEATEITISAQANGEIMQFNLEEGDLLKSGAIIGWIDTTDLTLKREILLSQIQAIKSKFPPFDAQIAVLEQERMNVERDQERIEKMFVDGAATQKQVDDISGQVDVIDKQIESVKTQRYAVASEIKTVEKQIDQVGEAVSKSVIINPVDGIVLTKYVNEFEIAMAGKPLYKIANLKEMKLKVYISGDQLPNVKIGQEVEVLVDMNETENRKLAGTISWISESAEFTPKIIQTKEERVNLVYAMKVLVNNDGTLKIGMPGEVNF